MSTTGSSCVLLFLRFLPIKKTSKTKDTNAIDDTIAIIGVESDLLVSEGLEGVGLEGVGLEGVGLEGVGLEGVGLEGVGLEGVEVQVGFKQL